MVIDPRNTFFFWPKMSYFLAPVMRFRSPKGQFCLVLGFCGLIFSNIVLALQNSIFGPFLPQICNQWLLKPPKLCNYACFHPKKIFAIFLGPFGTDLGSKLNLTHFPPFSATNPAATIWHNGLANVWKSLPKRCGRSKSVCNTNKYVFDEDLRPWGWPLTQISTWKSPKWQIWQWKTNFGEIKGLKLKNSLFQAQSGGRWDQILKILWSCNLKPCFIARGMMGEMIGGNF